MQMQAAQLQEPFKAEEGAEEEAEWGEKGSEA